MSGLNRLHRLITTGVLATAYSASLAVPYFAYAQTTDQAVTYELRPHCESRLTVAAFGTGSLASTGPVVAESACPFFSVKDPQTLKTKPLNAGDALDMDLVMHNPGGIHIERFRAWIAYDPSILGGDGLIINKDFSSPIPGEAGISSNDGYVKVSGTASVQEFATTIVIAHIRMHVLNVSTSPSPMTFYDVTGTPLSKTGVFVVNGTKESDIAATTQGILSVEFAQMSASASSVPASSTSSQLTSSSVSSFSPFPAVSQSSTATSVATSSVSSPAAAAATVSSVSTSSSSASSSESSSLFPDTRSAAPSAFDQLQVQRLRVTTDGSSAFLAWNKLPSSELVGYNLYYGSVSGNYIQKRSMDINTTNITIRNLPVDTTYYFAIRGVNAQNKETDFSQEVAVAIGNPGTSTAPLVGYVAGAAPSTPKTGGNISGNTGTPSVLLILLGISAAIGTGLALRRQLTAASHL